LNRTSRAHALVFLVFVAVTGLAFAKHNDALALKIPPGWKEGNQSEDRRTQMAIVEMVRDGEDIHNWKELLSEISAPKLHGVRKPEEMLDRLKATREEECPGSTAWNVIGKDEDSITYEWHAQPCLGQPEQVEIAKILLGTKTFYKVSYTKKVKELSADERDIWINWLGDAKLTDLP